MLNDHLRSMIYDKYIKPTENRRDTYAGIEIELPIINLGGKATDHTVSRAAMNRAVSHFGFQPLKYDDDGNLHEAQDPVTGDLFSFDCSYNNFEISFARSQNLNAVDTRFRRYIEYLNNDLILNNHLISGFGITPYYRLCRKDYIRCGRYGMLGGYLGKCCEWKKEGGCHAYPQFGTFASASQIQVDVSTDELLDTLRTFSLLEPVKSLLFANSMMPQDEPDYLLIRDNLWEYSTHGINPRNVGGYEAIPESIEELIEYIAYTSLFCTERDGKYLFFEPIPLVEYFTRDVIAGEYYENGKYYSFPFKPEETDLAYLRTYKFLDLTARGTIEYRSLCTQPLGQSFAGAAFQLGLLAKRDALRELWARETVLYHHGLTANELRRQFNKGHIPDVLDREALRSLLIEITRLSEEGLRERGFGEEKYLLPVYERAERISSPAKDMKDALTGGKPLSEIILEHAKL